MNDSDGSPGCSKWLSCLGVEGVLVVLSLIGVLVFTTGGPTVTLTCKRTTASEIFCSYVSQVFMLGGESGGLGNVRAAVDEERCEATGCSYRLMLITDEGKRPLTSDYTRGSKADLANRLNAFVIDPLQTQIQLTQYPDLTTVLVLGSVVLTAGLLIVVKRSKQD